MDDFTTNPKPKTRGSRFHLPFRSKASSSSSRAQSVDSAFQPSKFNPGNTPKATAPRSKLRKSSTLNKNDTLVQNSSLTPIPTNQSKRAGSFPVIRLNDGWERDKQTGELIDHTDLLHSLARTDSNENLLALTLTSHDEELAVPGQQIVSSLTPVALWKHVMVHLQPPDGASLAFSCKAFQNLLGTRPWDIINHPNHLDHRIAFLSRLDKSLPGHLLCFDCAIYHLRTQPGEETLKLANISNPLYNCPNFSNPNKLAPRIRITSGRAFPFTFVQLATRANSFTPNHGVTIDSLLRRYKDKTGPPWSHQTRYIIVKSHLLMRVASQCFATPGLPPAGERHLLYSQEDFVPYFSVCPHWRDGELMPMIKCALKHIPKPPEGSGVDRVAQEIKLHFHPVNPIVTLCSFCRPMRRCPKCPSEYLCEIKMAEDKSDPSKLFKYALVITRWSDLGDGSSPWSPEWAACTATTEDFDSFTALGRRAISGVFESEVYGDVLPGQKIVSLNPKKESKGEAGHNWY